MTIDTLVSRVCAGEVVHLAYGGESRMFVNWLLRDKTQRHTWVVQADTIGQCFWVFDGSQRGN